MARILCVNDFKAYSEMVAHTLRVKGGHVADSIIVPFGADAIEAYAPDVLVLNLVRKVEALGAPLTDFYTQVDGARAFRALIENPQLCRCPIVLTSIAVLEFEVPPGLPYVAFIEVPQKMDNLLLILDHIAGAPADRLITE